MDPFDETKKKVEYERQTDGNSYGQTTGYKDGLTLLRQRPLHAYDPAALPRPSIPAAAQQTKAVPIQPFMGKAAKPAVRWQPPGAAEDALHGVPQQPTDDRLAAIPPPPPPRAPPAVAASATAAVAEPAVVPGGLRGSKPLVTIGRDRSHSHSSEDNAAIVVAAAAANAPVAASANVRAKKGPSGSDVPAAMISSSATSSAGDSASDTGAADLGSLRFASRMPSIDMADIVMDKMIGGGAFGQVWRGSWEGTPVAVKVLPGLSALLAGGNGDGKASSVLQAFEDEVQMFARLRHPNICLFLGACLNPPTRAIVTELVPRGSLWEALRTPGLFPVSNALNCCRWISCCLRELLARPKGHLLHLYIYLAFGHLLS
jgi:hypothetical protein